LGALAIVGVSYKVNNEPLAKNQDRVWKMQRNSFTNNGTALMFGGAAFGQAYSEFFGTKLRCFTSKRLGGSFIGAFSGITLYLLGK